MENVFQSLLCFSLDNRHLLLMSSSGQHFKDLLQFLFIEFSQSMLLVSVQSSLTEYCHHVYIMRVSLLSYI